MRAWLPSPTLLCPVQAVQNEPLPPLRPGETIPISGGHTSHSSCKPQGPPCRLLHSVADWRCLAAAHAHALALAHAHAQTHSLLAPSSPEEVELHQGKTSPPDYLSEAELIGLMEKHGIGTGAQPGRGRPVCLLVKRKIVDCVSTSLCALPFVLLCTRAQRPSLIGPQWQGNATLADMEAPCFFLF